MLDVTAVTRYITGVIKTFQTKLTAAVFQNLLPKGMSRDLAQTGRRKLMLVDQAFDLNDLRNPPGNHLEALSGDRAGQHSIRINRQWRICFVWSDGDAYDVEIVDYH